MSPWKFFGWLLGHRLVWVLVFGIPAMQSFEPVYRAVDFYFYSVELHGVAKRHGIDVKSIALTGREVGPWQEERLIPWVELLVKINKHQTVTCRIDGQQGVFGRYLSEDPVVLEAELDRLLSSTQESMRLFVRVGSGQKIACSGSRDIGLSYAYVFGPFLILGVVFLMMTIRDLASYKNSSEKDYA